MDKQSPELDLLTYGVIDSFTHDTQPGSDSPLSPSDGWEGDEKAYLDLLRQRFSQSHYAQRMLRAASAVNAPSDAKQLTITGPYKDAALSALKQIAA